MLPVGVKSYIAERAVRDYGDFFFQGFVFIPTYKGMFARRVGKSDVLTFDSIFGRVFAYGIAAVKNVSYIIGYDLPIGVKSYVVSQIPYSAVEFFVAVKPARFSVARSFVIYQIVIFIVSYALNVSFALCVNERVFRPGYEFSIEIGYRIFVCRPLCVKSNVAVTTLR